MPCALLHASAVSRREDFEPRVTFTGFSIRDVAETRRFYELTLGLEVQETPAGLRVIHRGSGYTLRYPKDERDPATYT